MVPTRSASSAGKGWGRHWGAFKLLYYHCNTTKIDRVEQPRTVCGAEECRGVARSAEECRVALLPLKYHSNGKGRAAEDGLWYRGLPSGTV